MKKILSLVFLLVCFANFLFAGSSKIGTTAFNFIKLDYSARAEAMASAFSSIDNDINAIHYNPAGVALLKKNIISLYYSNYFLDVNYQAISLNQPITKKINMVFGVIYLDGGYIEKYNYSDISSGKARYYDLALLTAIATKIKKFKIGGTIKVLNETITDDSKTGFTAVVGAITSLSELTGKKEKKDQKFKNTNFGIVFKNYYGWSTNFGAEKDEKFPKTLSLGASTKFMDSHFISLDYNINNDNKNKLALGYEYYINKTFTARVGYKFSPEINEKNLSFGFGINTKISKHNLS
ncbi:MAG TPA: PorV/PorQ family protein [bacterium]|nr:PorV/PorQ family protein [bacterium]